MEILPQTAPSAEPLPPQVGFEQLETGMEFTLVDGTTMVVEGEFKGPNLDSYEGTNTEGEHVLATFEKSDAGEVLSVSLLQVNGETVFSEPNLDVAA